MNEDKAVYYLGENVTSLVEKLQNYIYGLNKKVLDAEEIGYLCMRLDAIDDIYGKIYCELIKETKLELFNRIFEEIHALSCEKHSSVTLFNCKLYILLQNIKDKLEND